MMSWMAPQQWAARPAPTGWAGSWPPIAPAGYPGPPPPPAGVDPTAWYGGQWQFNPMYRGGPAQQAQVNAWAPHPSWGPAAAPGANWNPYKRIPNRGDADYWNTKLLDNPLGLENMHIKNDAAKIQLKTAESPNTPWVWAPKDLSKSPEGHETALEPRNGNGARDSQDNSRPQSNGQQARRGDAPPAASTQQTRPSYSSSASHRRRESSAGPERAPTSAPAMVSSYEHQRQSSEHHSSARNQSVSSASASATRPSAGRSYDPAQEDKSFSSQQQLQPTFSPNIVRTPFHYVSSNGMSSASAAAAAAAYSSNAKPNNSTPTRRPSRDDTTRSPPHSHSHGPIYGPSTPNRSSSDPSAYTTPSRRSTAPTSNGSMGNVVSTPNRQSSLSSARPPPASTEPTLPFLSSFTDEPAAGMLSPLVVTSPTPRPSEIATRTSPGTGPNRASREVSRSSTYPLVSASSVPLLPVVPEGRSGLPSTSPSRAARPSPPSATAYPPTTPHRTPAQARVSPGDPRGLGRSHTYPTLDGATLDSKSATVSPLPSPNPPRTRASSPHSGSRLSNPLPPPPIPSAYPTTAALLSHSHSNSQPYSHSHPHSQPQHQAPSYSHSQPHYTSSTVRAPTSSSRTSSNSSSISTSSTAAPPPAQQPYARIRYGFWNKRGDHLIEASPSPQARPRDSPSRYYIVYAPRAEANPPELSNYPGATEGFKDHRGRMIKYDGNFPELPDSLPSHGEPPLRPYESFIKYVQ